MCVCPVPVECRLTESLLAVSGSWNTSGGSPMSIALPSTPGSRNPTALNRLLGSSGGLEPSVEVGAGGEAGVGAVVVGAVGAASVTTSTWKRLWADPPLFRDGFCPDMSGKRWNPSKTADRSPKCYRELSTCSKTTGRSRKRRGNIQFQTVGGRANIHRQREREGSHKKRIKLKI